MKYFGTSPPSMFPLIHSPSVTAGFRCAPLNCPTQYTATMTAMPHPQVMTIHPEFWALEWFSNTAATTPSPKRIRIAVPIVSAPMMLKRTPLLEYSQNRDSGATLRATLFGAALASQRDRARLHEACQEGDTGRRGWREPTAATGRSSAACGGAVGAVGTMPSWASNHAC